MDFPRPPGFLRLRTAALLSCLAVCAMAKITVALEPAGPLEPGEPWLFKPVVTGTEGVHGCHWAVAENGFLAGARAGVRLEVEASGASAVFTASGGRKTRTFLLRAASREDPSAFAVVTVQVKPLAKADEAAPAMPPGAAQPAAPAPAAPGPYVWALPVANHGHSMGLTAIAWDPRPPRPTVVAINRGSGGCEVLRLGLDGTARVLADRAPDGRPLECGAGGVAVMADGAVAFSEADQHRIHRIGPDGALTTLAGTGCPWFNGEEGLATRINLDTPAGLAVTRDGAIVVADSGNHRIRRIAGGCIETLAGGERGWPGPELPNDLRRRHPATAASLVSPGAVAAAPDGRILFADDSPAVYVLHPDGTLRRLGGDAVFRAPFETRPRMGALAVTGANEVMCCEQRGDRVWNLTRDGQLVPLAGKPRGPHPGDAAAPMVQGAEASLGELHGLAAVPGGLVANQGRQLRFIGPARGDGLLAEKVRQAGEPSLAAAVRASLAQWAGDYPANLDTARHLHFGVLAKGRLKGLSRDLERHICGFLPDERRAGLWLRALVALQVVDLKLRSNVPGQPSAPEGKASAEKARRVDNR